MRMSFIAMHVYTYEEFVLVTEAYLRSSWISYLFINILKHQSDNCNETANEGTEISQILLKTS